MLKDRIRKDIKKKLDSIEAIDRKTADIAICEYLITLPEIVNAEIIALYSAVEYEVDLSSFASDVLMRGKQLCYPRSLSAVPYRFFFPFGRRITPWSYSE